MRASSLRAGEADVGEPPLLLQPLLAVLVEAALAGKDALLPAGQEDQRELQPLGGVQGHDPHRVLALAAVEIEHQGDVLEIGAEAVERPHRLDQLLQIVEPRLAGRPLVGAQRLDIAALLEDGLGEALVRRLARAAAPAVEILEEEVSAVRARAGSSSLRPDRAPPWSRPRRAGARGSAASARSCRPDRAWAC